MVAGTGLDVTAAATRRHRRHYRHRRHHRRRHRPRRGSYANPGASDVPVALSVDRFDEPDIIEGARAASLHGTVTVGPGLGAGKSYTLYRWDDVDDVPTDGDYAGSKFTAKHAFTADASYV